jgi:hypothetical protein
MQRRRIPERFLATSPGRVFIYRRAVNAHFSIRG